MSDTKRRPTTVERVTGAVNRVLKQQGCNYCQHYKPADQVTKTRTRTGAIKFICDTCKEGRIKRKEEGNAPQQT